MSPTDTQLDGVGTHRLIEALRRRANILLVAIELKPEYSGNEGACRQVVHITKGHRSNVACLGMATLLHHEAVLGVRESVFGVAAPNDPIDG